VKDANFLILTGRLGKDSELSSTRNGSAILKFSIANNRPDRKQQDGTWQKQPPNWFNITMFGTRASALNPYLVKGQTVVLECHLDARSWDDKATGQKRYNTGIIADEVYLTGGKRDQSSGTTNARPAGSDYRQNGAQASPAEVPEDAFPPPNDIAPDEEIQF
jgi:single-strand DNA-binding protein